MRLLKLNELTRRRMVCDFIRESKLNLKSCESLVKSNIQVLPESQFFCSCKSKISANVDQNTEFFRIKHQLLTLDLTIDKSNCYTVKRLRHCTIKFKDLQPRNKKAKQKISRGSLNESTIGCLSNFINSICDYSNLDLIIYNYLTNN